MSEETPPPALRLKPRLRPPGETGGATPPAAPPAPEPVAASPAPPAAAEGAAPRLRLKPKLTVEPAAASEPAPAVEATAPETPPPAPAPAVEPERPRLKPRLTVEPAAAAQPLEPAPAPEPAPAAPPAPPAEPAASVPEAPPASTPAEPEAPKFKLKPKAPVVPPPAGTRPPMAPPPAEAKPATRPPLEAPASAQPPVLTPSGTNPPMPKPGTRPPMGRSGTRPPLDPQALADKAPAAPPKGLSRPATEPEAKQKKRLVLLGSLAAVLVLAAGGYFAWEKFMTPPPAPPPPAAPAAPAAKAKAPGAPAPKPAAVTPSETLNQIAAMPGAMVAKAHDVVAARREIEQNRVDAAMDGKELPDQRFLNTPLPGELGGKPGEPKAPTLVRTESQLAPGIRVSTTDLVASAPVSEEFRAFVSTARINGVFQGSPPRALINGRTIRAGDTADSLLGIVFDGVDPERKTITFKDRTGATLTRKY